MMREDLKMENLILPSVLLVWRCFLQKERKRQVVTWFQGWGVADGVNSSHLGVSNEDFYSRRSKNMNIIDKPVREIKEIRVFFSDGTYEAFVPSGK